MRRLLTLVTGIRSSGKSEYAEGLLARFSTVVYVATLPPLRIHNDTIRRHAKRRPASWRVVEVSGSVASDFLQIRAGNERAVLFEGFPVYLSRALCSARNTQAACVTAGRIFDELCRVADAGSLVVVVGDLEPTHWPFYGSVCIGLMCALSCTAMRIVQIQASHPAELASLCRCLGETGHLGLRRHRR